MKNRTVTCTDWDSTSPRVLRDAFTGAVIGTLMPRTSKRALDASAGIQSWSKPGYPSRVTLFDGGASIAQFSEYWEKHTGRTYPFSVKVAP